VDDIVSKRKLKRTRDVQNVLRDEVKRDLFAGGTVPDTRRFIPSDQDVYNMVQTSLARNRLVATFVHHTSTSVCFCQTAD